MKLNCRFIFVFLYFFIIFPAVKQFQVRNDVILFITDKQDDNFQLANIVQMIT